MRTGYKRETWEFGSSREVEEKHTGNYGARGQKREKKRERPQLRITEKRRQPGAEERFISSAPGCFVCSDAVYGFRHSRQKETLNLPAQGFLLIRI